MGRVVLSDVNLIDGEHAPRPNATVVVDGERIIAVAGNGDKVKPSPSDTVYQLKGKSLMPGMVNCHLHAGYHNVGGGMLGSVELQFSPSYMTLIAAKNVRELLLSGFTGAVGAGTLHNIDVALKQAINNGLIQGPRLLASGRDVVTTGASVDHNPSWWHLGMEGLAYTCDGPDEFRKAVRAEIRDGVDMIKLYVTIGHPMHCPEHLLDISQEELDAAVQATHERGKRIRGHMATKTAMLMAIRAGIDVIDHGDGLDGEGIEGILKKDISLIPSIFYPIRQLEAAKKRGEGHLPRWQQQERDIEAMCSVLPEASSAGVRIALGDDYGTTVLPHGEWAQELELYVKQAGMSPLDVIKWATKNGAELMGMGDQLGTVTQGKLADLLVVDGDPTVDIAVLQDQSKLLAVMKGGKFEKNQLMPVGK